MQFIANGPDIPDSLLQAHEDGRVVFFCGAGVSYPAGLPGFEGLVDNIYSLVGTSQTLIEQEAYTRGQFDATLDLLERRLPGQRIAVRTALAKALKPKLRRKGATDTHAALLKLARNRAGELRLVTTNFDRVFEYAAKRIKESFTAYAAPMLPIPKNSRWNGLVYLHGVLQDKYDDSALHRLVLTSGDFGLAYLTERWAARFVSELFRSYVVCFVGYTINDPVLRYMMDALAADRMLGETMPQAYAFGECKPGQESAKAVEWEAKGVIPILYEVPSDSNSHSLLHNTLKAWSETYRDGTLGKERIVTIYALARPSASTLQDDFVSRMLWALSHESGLPAKRFADFNPVPPLEWLEAFSEDRYRHGDLSRFGVSPHSKMDSELHFSFVRRPAPYNLAPWMTLISGGNSVTQWDQVMLHLSRWLARHLGDPALITWIAERGGQLHERLAWLIEQELDRFARLEREGKTSELNDIRANAPNAIPSTLVHTLWRLLLAGRVKSLRHNFDLYRWQELLKRDGLTATLRFELRKLLAPMIALRKPFRWENDDTEPEEPKRLRQLVDWELVLAADHAHSSVKELTDNHWREAFPALLDDLQQLLRDALDLLCELGEADNHSDRSHWSLSSISPHWQNRGFRDWVILIELLRDAWLTTRERDPKRAVRTAQDWFDVPYPTFKRMALFAASQENCIAPDQWVDWLLADNMWWLWSVETQRETMRLFVLQGTKASSEVIAKLETAILQGPPRTMFQDDIEPELWQSIVDHSVWLRLAKLREGGASLSDAASHQFVDLSAANPEFKLASNERDEFSHWMSGTGDPYHEENREIDIAPRKRQNLVKWLKQPPPERRLFYEDTWRETCETRFFHCFFALCDLSRENLWPAGRWREALQAWSKDGNVLRAWRYVAPLMQTMPDGVLQENGSSVTWWLEAVSKLIDRHETIFLGLCRRLLSLEYQNDRETDDPVFHAINHPIGHITQALLNLWFKRKPNDDDLLPPDIEPLFTQLCDTTIEQFRHGRVLLASRLIALFRIDRSWTQTHVLPLLDWNINSTEARAAWEGFLWSPRLYRPLLLAFKTQFLDTARYYADLGEHRRQFAALLTYAALDPVDGYSSQDYQTAISVLSQEGLREVAQALLQALEGAGEQREDYWKNRIVPFWQQVWPKSSNLVSNSIAESLARLSIAARGEFPSALSIMVDWIRPIEHPHYVVHLLYESELSERFPLDALRLLDAVLDKQPFLPRELHLCLEAISNTAPQLAHDPRFQRLSEYSRQHSI